MKFLWCCVMVEGGSPDSARQFSVCETICLSLASSISNVMVLLEITLFRWSKNNSSNFFWNSSFSAVVG